jgi:hypothetical protein
VSAFLFCDRFFRTIWFANTGSARLFPPRFATPSANKRLMACGGHWKFVRVLPMFQVHPLAADPVFGHARLNAASFARWEIPRWMK